MYPSHEQEWYDHLYRQESYFASTPFQSEYFHHPAYDERQSGPGLQSEYFYHPAYDERQFGPGFQSENFHHPAYDERQFGPGFPSQGGPMGPPPGMPGSQPPFAPPGQGPGTGPPTAPPPSYVPAQTQQAGTFAVDPGSIRRCLFRYTYVWLRGREQFWFYPTFIGRTSISGYRWTGFRWIFFGIDLRQIQSFTCV